MLLLLTVAEFESTKPHVISESRNRSEPEKNILEILPVGLRQLLNGSNARWTPKQHISDLVADTNEPVPDIHVPDTIMTDHTFTTIQV